MFASQAFLFFSSNRLRKSKLSFKNINNVVMIVLIIRLWSVVGFTGVKRKNTVNCTIFLHTHLLFMGLVQNSVVSINVGF